MVDFCSFIKNNYYLCDMTNNESKRNTYLQELCRYYLEKIKASLSKYNGLSNAIGELIEASKRNECAATEDEVEALSRLLDEERMTRTDVPKLLGESYRQSVENNDMDKVRRLKHVGIYSRVSALLLKHSR